MAPQNGKSCSYGVGWGGVADWDVLGTYSNKFMEFVYWSISFEWLCTVLCYGTGLCGSQWDKGWRERPGRATFRLVHWVFERISFFGRHFYARGVVIITLQHTLGDLFTVVFGCCLKMMLVDVRWRVCCVASPTWMNLQLDARGKKRLVCIRTCIAFYDFFKFSVVWEREGERGSLGHYPFRK